MSETKVSEAVQDGTRRVRKVTRNRKRYGQIEHYRADLTIYWTKRSRDQFHQLTASWLLECDTISAIKLYGVTHVGLQVDDGSKYLIHIGAFGPAGIEQGVLRQRSNAYVDPRGVRGAMCWYVPEPLWSRHLPPQEKRAETILEGMRLKRARLAKT